MSRINQPADRRILSLCLFGVFWFCFSVVTVCLNAVPCDDTAARYAPMAEAFAQGDLQNAFHPRFGIFFTGLAGSIVYLTGLDGFRGCQAAALLLYFSAVFPVYWLACRVWGKKVAWYNVILYLMCSHLLRLVWEGLRDPGKILGFMLMSYGIIVIAQEYAKKEGIWHWQPAVLCLQSSRGTAH